MCETRQVSIEQTNKVSAETPLSYTLSLQSLKKSAKLGLYCLIHSKCIAVRYYFLILSIIQLGTKYFGFNPIKPDNTRRFLTAYFGFNPNSSDN